VNLFHLREPISAWSHAIGAIFSVPATLSLWHQSRGQSRAKRISLLIYGLSMLTCYEASTLFHGAHGSAARIATFNLFDHIGIYLYIAGTYTSVAWNVLRAHWRRWTLTMAWLWAFVGSLLQLSRGDLPPLLSTGLYMGMGWAMVFIYYEMARVISHRAMQPIVVGGLCYTVGAVLNVMGWPEIQTGVFGSHEIFHLLVLAGSGAHFWFILKVVVPLDLSEPETAVPQLSWDSLVQSDGSIFRLDPRAMSELRRLSRSSRDGSRTGGSGRAA
jgi:hemolysin III